MYQSKEGSQITLKNLNPRFVGDCRREEFMAVTDFLAGVGDTHFYGWGETINNISYHSSYNQWL